MANDTIFRIMSMTKPIACVGLMMLYEEGRFLLDQPISCYLPYFKNMTVKKKDTTEPAKREITIRDCLTHTAGFSFNDYHKIVPLRQFKNGQTIALIPGTRGKTINMVLSTTETVEEAVKELAKLPLNFHPGTDWEYHPGHDVVGVLIEKISGQRLDKFLQERILDPLKMKDTHFYLPKEKVDRFAAGYIYVQNEWGMFGLADCPRTSAKVIGRKTFFPAGSGLVSTAADYARFAQMLLNGGILDGAHIIGRKTIELMTTNHTGNFNIYPKGPGYGYGLGFFVRLNLSDAPWPGTPGTYGWGGAYCTSYFADPKEDLFGLQFTQVLDALKNPELPIRPDFERMVYQALV
jgi:CubicO group peptidase (beta-lactamase class C family)